MAQNKGASQSWDDGLKLISFCPLCETHYNPMEAKQLGASGEVRLLHITCKGCSNSIIALVTVGSGGVSSVGLITDLTYRDVVKFRSSNAVEADDVLDVHGILEDDKHFWASLART